MRRAVVCCGLLAITGLGAPGLAPLGNAVPIQPEPAEPVPPKRSPARGPPLWEDGDAEVDEGLQIEADWDLAAQPAPDFAQTF